MDMLKGVFRKRAPKKKLQERDTKSLSALDGKPNKELKKSRQLKKSNTDEYQKNQNQQSQVPERNHQQSKQPWPNAKDNKPSPKHPVQKPPQPKINIEDKYNELIRKIREMESNFEADKEEILKSLDILRPGNDIDEAEIDRCAGNTKKMLDTLISRTKENTEFDLKQRRTEKTMIEREFEAGEAHLKDLHETRDSTRKEFQNTQNMEEMKCLFDGLNKAFESALKNNLKAQKDYDKLYAFIADDGHNCKTCKAVQTSSQVIKKKIQSDDTAWADNFNKKISISLATVEHVYDTSEINNIKGIRIDQIMKLHKLFSGCKDEVDINIYKKPSNRHSQSPQTSSPPSKIERSKSMLSKFRRKS